MIPKRDYYIQVFVYLQQPYHYQRTNVKVTVLCPDLVGISIIDDLSQNISNPDILLNYQSQK